MLDGLRTGLRGLQHLQHRGYQYVWINFFWLLLSLPIITAPAAYAGLVRFSYVAHRQPSVSFDEFWQGFRENLKRGALIGLLNLIVVVVNVGNLVSYQTDSSGGVVLLRVVWLIALVGWFAAQIYVWPLLNAMENPSLKGAYRNAGVMMLLNPLFTLGIWFVCAAVIVLSTALPVAWLLVTGSALASIANAAVQSRLLSAGLDKSSAVSEVVTDEVFYDTY